MDNQLLCLLERQLGYQKRWCTAVNHYKTMHTVMSQVVQGGEGKPNQGVDADGVACELKLYLGGSETTPAPTREMNVMRCRCMASRMLGRLTIHIQVFINILKEIKYLC